ncbi:hypothetical protein LPB248_06345 [Flavobacterium sp. LPB0248]|uniref:hypothetical protein n=1 Tax=Flavobacterium sp. LPB0248 TaxID=2614441 RepID=UPI0015A6FC58|nr:hypothetical protein [Flavobacterium sp. LPB0248]QLC65917.1 hypothetical protein LPB248_06345 [Flavobacterium sp. LPB0248]
MDAQLKQASERWKKEGKEFKTSINKWLDKIYIEKQNPTTECPKETRKDLGEYVLENLIEYNNLGKYEEFRELFPPDNDPLSDIIPNLRSYTIKKVAILENSIILAKLGDYHEWQGVYKIKDNEITFIDDVIGFGFSSDKKYFAKVYNNKIDIHKDWNGDIICSLELPNNISIDELCYENIEVFNNGREALLITYSGIFVINENGFDLIHGEKNEDEDEDSEYTFIHYPHAVLSADNQYIAVGSQMSEHIVLKKQNGKWEETANIDPISYYPNVACFNSKIKEPLLALGSCHFSESGTIGVPLKNIEGMNTAADDIEDDSISVIEDRRWIFSMYPSEHGFFLGANDGYLWHKLNNEKIKYAYIGGTIMSIDISQDKKHIVVSNECGQIFLLQYDSENLNKDSNTCTDPYLISNLPLIDKKRYFFLADCQPLIW